MTRLQQWAIEHPCGPRLRPLKSVHPGKMHRTRDGQMVLTVEPFTADGCPPGLYWHVEVIGGGPNGNGADSYADDLNEAHRVIKDCGDWHHEEVRQGIRRIHLRRMLTPAECAAVVS